MRLSGNKTAQIIKSNNEGKHLRMLFLIVYKSPGVCRCVCLHAELPDTGDRSLHHFISCYQLVGDCWVQGWWWGLTDGT